MKLIHISDLHLGKKLHECSLIEDQLFCLNQVVRQAITLHVDGVIIAGDIYDKSIPSEEAVLLFDDFLTKLTKAHIPIYLISGNHDSAKRLAFGTNLLAENHIHIASIFDQEIKSISLEDEYGTLYIHLIPFVKPSQVKALYPNEEIHSYEDAFAFMIKTISLDESKRHILVAHQFFSGATICDSERLCVGGTEQISLQNLEGFDYVALGHLHMPQKVGRETIRYCGSLLKYSFSETNHMKSMTVVELKEKGNVLIQMIPFEYLHDVKELKGTYLELTSKAFYQELNQTDYYHITLEDDHMIMNALGKLRTIYPNLLKLDYQQKKHHAIQQKQETQEYKSDFALFEELFYIQNNKSMNELQTKYMKQLLDEIEVES